MGSNETLTQEEVADILQMSIRGVQKYAYTGMLRVVERVGSYMAPLYSKEEVYALKEAKAVGITLPELAEMVQQSWAAARVAQRQVQALERMLGLHANPAHNMDADSIKALHAEAHDDLSRKITGAARVTYWADIFEGICEQYFIRVEEVTEDKECPWNVYMLLGTQLAINQNHADTSMDPEEMLAYKRLHVARKNLRNAVFIYMMQRYGRRAAMRTFEHVFEGEDYAVRAHTLAAVMAREAARRS